MRTCVMLAAGALLVSIPVQAQVTLNASMSVDNLFTASISDNPLTAGTPFLSGANWQLVSSGTFVFPGPGTYFLQVQATDQGPPAMFIGQFSLTGDPGATFSNGTASLLTETTDWVVSNTGFGVNTVAPQDLGPNGMGPWGHFPEFDNAAQYLWAPVYTPTVFFTSVITIVPAPASAGFIGLGALALVRRRR
jgi:uncharacterized protein (TIGR03382 family)